MLASLFLAKVISAYLVVVGLMLILRHKRMKLIVEQISESYALIAISGIIALILGLLIVNSHNIWTTVWQGIISVLGWIMVVNGVVRLLVPEAVKRFAPRGSGEVFFIVWGVVLLIVGIYLGYVGYFYHHLLAAKFH